MAPSDMYLHIGAPKTGTTYLQDMLWANKDVLDRSGVLVPGHYRYARVPAVRDVLKWSPDGSEPLPQRWRRLAGEMKRWNGHASILSQEFICRLTDGQTHAVVDSLGSRSRTTVHAILTVRDISRLVVAQWQTEMRSRRPWILDDYCAAAAGMSTHDRATFMHDHFWLRHDYRTILARWIREVGLDNVTVVTVPTSGSDPEELWRRFCTACDIKTPPTGSAEPRHESLGAASAELMRQLNQHELVRAMDVKTYQRSVNTSISRRGLVNRRGKEPKLSLPSKYREWAERAADDMITQISRAGVRVIGDLEDLRPSPARGEAVVPEEQPASALLDACTDALAGLVLEHAKLSHAQDPDRPVVSDRTESDDPQWIDTIKRARAKWRRRAPLR